MNFTNITNDTYPDVLFSTFNYETPITALLIVSFALVFLLCVIGNSIVCFVIIRTPKLRTVTNYFILNLAVSDLLLAIFCTPFTLVYHVLTEYPFGEVMCKLTPFVQGISVAASVFTLLAIAYDRYKAIVFPTETRMSIRTMQKLLVAVWLLAVVIMIPQVFNMHLRDLASATFCVEIWPDVMFHKIYTVLLMCFVYIGPLVCVSYLYSRIVYRIWYRPNPSNDHAAATGPNHRVRQEEFVGAVPKRRVRVIKMLILVVVLFTLSWLPLYTLWILHDFVDLPESVRRFIDMNIFPAAHWLAYSNSCVNPLVYGFYNSNIRQKILSMFSCDNKNDCVLRMKKAPAEAHPLPEQQYHRRASGRRVNIVQETAL
ncbi:neuropeptide FF receptor 2-like [Branchiostoma floridae]|uniref:Neuropeptide FF receptor 2-like n=1 Tax=Branchiostoma floridae TaxID=7739 RepID=A0A9J7KSC3_BRAFL|nr:neuropeptide FF receptor 2-like [Branchiostoma floridae]XP_035669409.1 neuropeptide FF receptor 2-like [Branchiostoma floridae]